MTNKPVDLDVLDSDVLEDKDKFKQPSVDKKHYGVKVKGDAIPVLDSDIFAERDKYKPQTVDNKRYAVEVKEDVNPVQGVDADGDGKPKEIIGASASGGSSVIANPELSGDEPDLSGLEVDEVKFKVPEAKVYTAGNGIAISEEDAISVDTSVIQEKLTAGNGIAISEEGVISLDIAVADEEEF